MFCYQCQETAGNAGCTRKGVCGKDELTANLQDLLVYSLKGLAALARRKAAAGAEVSAEGALVMKALFATITNANFDPERITALVREAEAAKLATAAALGDPQDLSPLEGVRLAPGEPLPAPLAEAGILSEGNEDVRSLRELIVYGLKGLAAYGDHALVLGYEDPALYRELLEILAETAEAHSVEELMGLVLRAGQACVQGMALLDKANTETYGHPEVTRVKIGVGSRPGILVSGHDLKDLEELLEQTAGTGVDVYTHGEMLPAHYYPRFKSYPHFVGNYGGSWWKQGSEFADFGGPILMTTNCIIPVKEAYRDRIFTTGMTGYPGVPHIPDRVDGRPKDFSALIALARSCAPPKALEDGEIVGGFAHDQVERLAPAIVEAVKAGKLRKFVVMAGCDGRQHSREYFTELAGRLPQDAVILTAGCAKYRYNKLDLGDIDGIPRVLDAGQCNDSYSLAVTALKLKEILGVADVNDLPIDFAIGWYEQKAVCVLLALLALGFKGVRIGPTLPAFVSENVKRTLVEGFGLKATGEVEADLEAIIAS
ncbi:MAG: hydroxylamine reductase [Spirochaetales bacterium]|nr:hydroxylamine reductase [Spirochaetales bacterium]